MARYIELNAAVTEIERRISSLHPKGGQRIVVTKILKDHYKDYLSFLNTLEAKEVQEEPVSKDLEEASKKWLRPQLDKSYAAYGLLRQMELTHFDGYAMLDAIEFGAKWKEEQFKKNLLDVCKKQTEEEAEIERDFIEGIIDEHRLPTFDDAIKYGMRLQKEQMMKDAIDAELDDVCGFLTISIPYHNGIAGDKVKVVIIKSE